ncbi:hypothetical protein [Paenibacillus jiagnxiensis]|uniref:hypothetical protein n=1 Tax=Paenibacillus jiagnxiensis TaxID=3228926 RepID=UPI0033B2C6FF
MKTLLFLGACEKTELLLWLGKILASADHKVLIIDATVLQKYRYSIPDIGSDNLVTEYDDMDVASGFEHSFTSGTTIQDSLMKYFSKKNEDFSRYEYVLIDVDHTETLQPALLSAWGKVSRYVLVTNSERYTIDRNALLIEKLLQEQKPGTPKGMDIQKKTDGAVNIIGEAALEMVRIHYPAIDQHISEEYIDSTMAHLSVEFEKQEFEFYYDELDYTVSVKMQYESRIKLKGLSRSTRKTLASVLGAVTDLDSGTIKSAIRSAEKGR